MKPAHEMNQKASTRRQSIDESNFNLLKQNIEQDIEYRSSCGLFQTTATCDEKEVLFKLKEYLEGFGYSCEKPWYNSDHGSFWMSVNWRKLK